MCFGSGDEDDFQAGAARNREIEKMIRVDEKKMAKEVKLLLLGQSGRMDSLDAADHKTRCWGERKVDGSQADEIDLRTGLLQIRKGGMAQHHLQQSEQRLQSHHRRHGRIGHFLGQARERGRLESSHSISSLTFDRHLSI
jgi:hypothetical protein